MGACFEMGSKKEKQQQAVANGQTTTTTTIRHLPKNIAGKEIPGLFADIKIDVTALDGNYYDKRAGMDAFRPPFTIFGKNGEPGQPVGQRDEHKRVVTYITVIRSFFKLTLWNDCQTSISF